MKKHCYKLLVMGCLGLLFITQLYLAVSPGYAQTPEPAPAALVTPVAPVTAVPPEQSQAGVSEVTFTLLEQPTMELRSPIDQQSFSFNIPYRWTVIGGESYLEVHYDLQYETAEPAGPARVGSINAMVNIYYNDTLLTAFIPTEGMNQALRLPLPHEAIGNPAQSRHQVRFSFFSGNCDEFQEEAIFVVHDHSFIHFNYELAPLQINLADFPQPLVQDLFEPESVLLIIPDEYSESDLAAAASIAATLGHRTFNEVTSDIITASEATPERLAQSSAIIIGQPQTNTFIGDLYQRNRLPTTLTPDGSAITGPANQPILPDDGVLQEILSDYSPDHVYLVVTGANEAAVTHAAQALSVSMPRYGFTGDLVVISEFHEILAETTPPSSDVFSLSELGFKDTTLSGIDAQRASVRFFIPSNWRITDKPRLLLSYAHSTMLRLGASSLIIKLNNEPVGSAPIDQTVLGERQAVIELPKSDLRLGAYNRLEFESSLSIELPECALPDLDLAWLRINDTSQLELPHTETEEQDILASLDVPLTPFASRSDLGDTWFSLPEKPTREELAGLIRLAGWLGNLSKGAGFVPRVSLGVVSDTTRLEQYHVIVLGRPTTNPLLAEINDNLPQPFVPNEDNLRQEVGNVVYRLPDKFSLGLLQVLPAPWNPGKKVILAITGTTPEGVGWAINALTDDTIYYNDLRGDVAFIRAERVESFDSAKFIRGPLASAVEAVTEPPEEVALEMVPTPVPPPSTPAPQTEVELPEKYLPQNPTSQTNVNLLTLGLIVAGLVVAGLGNFLNRRKAKSH
ncbi:MAG: cellulose biosynthesis cyclic di-GMP-binding regulatory protein BcsB [Anaerolineae bacterium]|nr:cellulose biosynthesis cyclic di-GMP-binding regulatory protein BcsB [Anaerolineae bacterium]